MKKKSTPKKKVVKKGWVLAIGLSSRDRKKIKFGDYPLTTGK